MSAVEVKLSEAMQWHEAGRTDAASQAYLEIIRIEPRHAMAHYLLGVVALQKYDDHAAVDWLRKALLLDSQNAEFHSHYGLALSRLGNSQQAIKAWQQSLRLVPQNSWVLSLLGLEQQKQGRILDAAQAYEQCLSIDPSCLDAANNLGNIRKMQERFGEAEQLYLQALQISPRNPDVLFNLSQVYHDAERYDLAVTRIQQAIQARPERADWYVQLSRAFSRLGQVEAATKACQHALQLEPNLPMALQALGDLYVTKERFDQAYHVYCQAVAIQPQNADVLSNLGATCQKLGRLEEALGWHQRVLQIEPRSVTTLCNLGYLFLVRGRYDAAISHLKRALAVDSNHVETLFHYAAASAAVNQLDQASQALQRVIYLRPDHIEAYYRLGSIYREQHHHDLALETYLAGLQANPDADHLLACLINQKQTLCLWDGLNELAERLFARIQDEVHRPFDDLISPFIIICSPVPSTAEQQYRAARKYVYLRESMATEVLHQHSPGDLSCIQRKIRIGYLSGDFQMHPVGYLVAELFESHDRDQFEIFGYSFGFEDSSSLRKRLANSFDTFRDIHRLSFRQAAEQIASDRIDILIDLQGFTAHNRCEILLMRPAPIQVNFLGYPGTLGGNWLDYILVDSNIVPKSQQPFFSEKLVQLPGCFLVNDSKREIDSKTPIRSHLSLPEDGFVFCAFNSNYKMTREMFEIWMRLLHRVPGSVLWLRDGNQYAVENLKNEAKRCGVDERRLIMAGGLPMPKHLSRHRAADLFLDTFPYNQHSTAADALRMGLPMVTLMGETFASRVAGSILRTLGLPELIATSHAQYETIAAQLATDRDYLQSIRLKLQQSLHTTDLYDGAAFARKLESAYQDMWQEYNSRA